MKKFISIFAALVLSVVANSTYAEFKWQHFGADPYATTRAEAMRTRESAFRKMGHPIPVIAQLIRATEKPGEIVRITNGDRFSAMLSKGGVVHRNVVVAFVKPPISGKMEYAAPAERWKVSWEGKNFIISLPDICGNWAYIVVALPPVPPEKKCVELSFNAPVGGNVRWGIGTTTGPLLPDECNAQRQGDGAWTAWYGECDTCIPAIGYIQGILGGSAQIPHKYLYPVTHTRQTLRFSTEVWSAVVYICLEDALGRQSCGVYMRPQDWKDRYHVEIPDSMWIWGDCPR